MARKRCWIEDNQHKTGYTRCAPSCSVETVHVLLWDGIRRDHVMKVTQTPFPSPHSWRQNKEHFFKDKTPAYRLGLTADTHECFVSKPRQLRVQAINLEASTRSANIRLIGSISVSWGNERLTMQMKVIFPTATSRQRPLFVLPAGCPYIHSYFNFSSTVTSPLQ